MSVSAAIINWHQLGYGIFRLCVLELPADVDISSSCLLALSACVAFWRYLLVSPITLSHHSKATLHNRVHDICAVTSNVGLVWRELHISSALL